MRRIWLLALYVQRKVRYKIALKRIKHPNTVLPLLTSKPVLVVSIPCLLCVGSHENLTCYYKNNCISTDNIQNYGVGSVLFL